MEPIRIGFTGSRNGLNLDQEQQIKLLLNKYDNIIVSHGDCVGADTDFHNLCVNYKKENPHKIISIHIFPPNNPVLRAFNQGELCVIAEPKPYLERNLNIIKNSSILIGCPTDKNNEVLRSGTWSTIRQARKRNLEIYLF